MSLVWWLASAAVVLLVIAASRVTWLNWGPEMRPRVISALGVAAITLLVTVLATLKPYHGVTRFTTSVLVDTKTGKVPVLIPQEGVDLETLPTDRAQWNNDLAASANQVASPGALELPSHLGKLLQFRLLDDLRALQVVGTGVTMMVGLQAAKVTPQAARVTLPDQVELNLAGVIGLDTNPFLATEGAQFRFQEMGRLRVPAGSSVTLGGATTPERRTIAIEKLNFFRLTLTIEPIYPGVTALPPHGYRVFLPQDSGGLSAFVYDVTIDVDFDETTAANWRTEHYKRWAGWIAVELARRNSFS